MADFTPPPRELRDTIQVAVVKAQFEQDSLLTLIDMSSNSHWQYSSMSNLAPLEQMKISYIVVFLDVNELHTTSILSEHAKGTACVVM